MLPTTFIARICHHRPTHDTEFVCVEFCVLPDEMVDNRDGASARTSKTMKVVQRQTRQLSWSNKDKNIRVNSRNGKSVDLIALERCEGHSVMTSLLWRDEAWACGTHR